MSKPAAGAIDCDVHIAVPGTNVLKPYLSDLWREHVTVRGIDDLELMYNMYKSPIACRPDWRENGRKPGTSFDLLQKHVLDGFGARAAICNALWGGAAIYGEDLSAVLCQAVNDWVAKEWLDRDPRVRASISVPLEHPERAAEEIHRCAKDKRFVQVLLLAMGDAPLGKRRYWPIYEAAEKHGLAIGIHAGTTYRQSPANGGWPSFFIEDYVSQAAGMQTQLLSLIFEGVFAKYPNLRVVMMESGVTWLPHILWRADKTWRGLRIEVPWVKEPPSEIVQRHMRFTLQPFDAPPSDENLEKLFNHFGSDKMFLFSSDYPHWHFDGDEVMPEGLPSSLMGKAMLENPLETYSRLKETLQ